MKVAYFVSKKKTNTQGYSATVDLHLDVNGCVFSASQIGPDRVDLREDTVLPDGPAEVIAVIDGLESRWPVRIENRSERRRIIPIEIIRGQA